MNFIKLSLILLALVQCLTTNELRIQISAKNSRDVSKFLSRMFPQTPEDTDVEINADIKIKTQDTKGGCELCQMLINDLFKLIKHRTEDEINRAFQKVCDSFPFLIRGECRSIVQKYSVKITELILAKVPKDMICKRIGLCMVCPRPELEGSTLDGGLRADVDPCRLCRQVVYVVSVLVSDYTSKTMVSEALNKVCRYLPLTYIAQCLTFVRVHRMEITRLFLDGMCYNGMCSSMALCGPLNMTSQMPLSPSMADASSLCNVCLRYVQEYEMISPVNSTENEQQNLLKRVCDRFPVQIRMQCTALVKRVEEKIEESANEGTSKLLVCEKLGNCVAKLEEDNIVECWICTEIMKQLASLVNSKSTVADIVNALNKVCQILPGNLKGQCRSFVERFVNQIVKFLISGYAPHQVCRLLALCQEHDNLKFAPSISSVRDNVL